MNELVLTNLTTLTNKELKKATSNIVKASQNINKNLFTVAKELNNVAENNLFVDDGFKNVEEYANKVFGFRKSTTYNFISIGKLFTNNSTLTSNLDYTEHDYSVSQLTRLIPLGSAEVANNLIAEEKFNENSTIKEIEKAVKEYLHPEEEPEDDENDEVIDGEGEEIEVTSRTSFSIVKTFNDKGYKISIENSNGEEVFTSDCEGEDSLDDCVKWLLENLR